MLEKLGFKKRTHIGISLSANNFIELVCIDKSTRNIIKYVSRNIKYNNAIKEIVDFDEFTEVLTSLFEEADLEPTDCAVTLSLPNVHFDLTPLEENTDDVYVRDNLQSDIEDLYIFKRNEPYISYTIADRASQLGGKNVIYSAIQIKMLNKVIEIFDAIGAELTRIESSYISLLKALKYADKFHEYMQKEEKTLVMLITSSSCSTFYVESGQLVDYLDEPLAIKSFSPEEVYLTISKIAENATSKNDPKTLIIISETDDVNAELLSQRIGFSGQVEFINKSVAISDPFVDVSPVDTDIDPSMVPYITIESVGAAASDFDEYPLEINFLPPERINNNMVVVGPYEVDFIRFLIVVLGGAVLLALIIGLLINAILGMQIDSMENSGISTKSDIKVFKETIAKSENNNQKDILPRLTEILDNNKKLVEAYISLSTEIPENIFIKRFVANENGGIGILGEAKTSESVENFVNRLRERNNSLMLSRLQVNTKYDPIPAKIPNGFTFEIKTNGKEVSLVDDTLLQNTNSSMQDIINNLQNTNGQQSVPSSGAALPPPSPIL